MELNNERYKKHLTKIAYDIKLKDDEVIAAIDRIVAGESFKDVASSMHKTNFDLRLDIKSYAYRNDKTVQDVLGDKASTIGGRTNDEDYEAKVAKVKVVLEDIKAGKTVKEAAAEHNMTSVGVYKNVKWLSYIAPEYVAEYKTIVDSHRSGIKK